MSLFFQRDTKLLVWCCEGLLYSIKVVVVVVMVVNHHNQSQLLYFICLVQFLVVVIDGGFGLLNCELSLVRSWIREK